jgi:hypothetical protein
MRRLKEVHHSGDSSSGWTRRERRARVSKKTDDAAEQSRWVTGPTLREMLDISSVTLWRWRHREHSAFPTAKSINGRLYFYWPDVQAWLDKQPVAA